jgi:autotransporter-associated beta strand protein
MKTKFTTRLTLLSLGSAFLIASSASAADYTWGGGDLLWDNITATGWNGTIPATADTATINGGTVTFHNSDVYGNAANTASAAITVNTGGTLASGEKFNSLWNLTLGGGTLLSNGGANATYGTYNLAGTVTAKAGVTSSISTGIGNNNFINLGNGSSSAVTNTTFNVGAAGTLNVGTVLRNHSYFTGSNQTSVAGLIKTGAGQMTLSAANTYTGATVIQSGKLTISSTGQLAGGATNVVTIGADNTAATAEFNYNSSTALARTVSFATGSTGGILSGSGTISSAVTITSGNTLSIGNSVGQMNFSSNLTLLGAILMEIDGPNPTGQNDFANVTGALTYGGSMTLDVGTLFGVGSYSWNLFDMGSETGTFSGISLADQYSGSLSDADLDGIWNLTSGNNTWQFTESSGVLGLTVIPEPSAALLGGLGMILLLRRRR